MLLSDSAGPRAAPQSQSVSRTDLKILVLQQQSRRIENTTRTQYQCESTTPPYINYRVLRVNDDEATLNALFRNLNLIDDYRRRAKIANRTRSVTIRYQIRENTD